jgi:hypothetical protein
LHGVRLLQACLPRPVDGDGRQHAGHDVRQGRLACSPAKAAGAILLGKTNLLQMMTWHECDNWSRLHE